MYLSCHRFGKEPPCQPLTRPHLLPYHFFKENSTPWLPAAMADCIACGAATPNLHGAASSQHHGQRSNASVLSESTVGASNWGGSTKANSIDFFTHNNQLQMWLIALPVVQLCSAAAKLLPPPSCRRRCQAALHYRTEAAAAALLLQPPQQCCR